MGVTGAAALAAEIQRQAKAAGVKQMSGTSYSDIKIDVVSTTDPNNIADNVLSEYIIYQYNIALSMLPLETCTRVQEQLAKNDGTIKTININTDLGIDGDRSDRSVTLASTGETKRNVANLNVTTSTTTRVIDDLGIVGMPQSYDITDVDKTYTYQSSEWNYYSIDSVTIENVLAPSANNPSIADMLTLKMRLIEPHGFRFAEDIRQIADGLGYSYVPSTRYLWRIDIWFSGYDMRGNWYDNIPLKSTAASTPIEALSYYVNLATVEAKLDGRGTVYELGFVPGGHQAWRPEDVVFDSLTITSAGQNNFGEFLDTLARVMEDTRKQTSDSNIKRRYEFYAPDVVRSSKFNSEKFFNKKNMLGPGGGDAKSKAKDVDVIKLLEEAWADCENLQDLFLADKDNDQFLKPRIMIAIEFNTVYGAAMSPGSKPPTDQSINDFDVITHQYKLVPFVTFKRGTPTKASLKNYLDPANQLTRIKTMISLGMINRVYDYLYTGDNTEVINLDLNFQKFYYYVPIWPATSIRPNSVGVGNSATPGNLQTAVAPGAGVQGLQLNGLDTISVDRVLNQIFGRVDLNSPTVDPNADYFQRIGVGGSGMNTLPYPSMLRMAISEGAQQRAAKYSYYQSDHLQYDMLKIDLEIRGDPVWLMSAYANGSISPLKPLPDKLPNDILIVPKTDRCLFLRVHAPKQSDYMNPSRTAGSSDPMLIGGFYQVYKVLSTFTSGKFTQKLECGKYEHLNYIEQFSEKGYGQLFVIPFAGSPDGAVAPGTVPTTPPGTTTTTTPGQPVTPDTNTIIIPASPGRLPTFEASNPNANSFILGLRNNNPGNMRPGGRWDGTVGSYRGFDVYDSPQRGVQNLWKNLIAYNRNGNNTIQKIISTWAPPSDGNNTSAYIRGVCSACGVGPNDRLDYTNKTQMNALINSIITHEIGGGTMYTPAYINTSLGW